VTDTQDKRLEEVALFRYGVIADLIHTQPGWRGLGKRLSQKAELSYAIPGSRRARVAAETMRHWLKAYRRRGFDGLKPKRRRDAGRSHALPQVVADALCQLKEDRPELSVQLLIKEVIAAGPRAGRPAPAAEHGASPAVARGRDEEARAGRQGPSSFQLRARRRAVDERRNARPRGRRRRQHEAQDVPHRAHR
jgi:hypothetical protein